MIRKDFIKRKISLIQDDLAHLAEFARCSFDEIVADFVKEAAMERILERIINRAVDINQHLIAELVTKDTSSPKDYTETFLLLSGFGIYSEDFGKEISKSIGTRNKLVHEYDKVDYFLIYDSVGDCLRDYHQYCEYILKFIEK
jgi:uncharacterized protein YutE (UPF0331/DUF86 family)